MKRVIYGLLLLTALLLPGFSLLNAAEVAGKAKLAQELVGLLVDGKYSDVVGMFDDTMKAALPEEKLAEVWKSIISQTGKFKKQQKIRQEKVEKYVVVYVTCLYENVSLDTKVIFGEENKVGGLSFVPTQTEEKSQDKE
jgi:uncharacterized protein